MKKKKIIIILLVLCVNVLCYKQDIGINYTILSLSIFLCYILTQPKGKALTKFQLTLLSTLTFIGILMFIYYTPNLLLAYIITLILLSGYQVTVLRSWCYSLVQGIYSILLSCIKQVISKLKSSKKKVKIKTNIIIFGIASGIMLLFILLYNNSNETFHRFLTQFSFTSISWSWVLFTLLSILFIVGFFTPYSFQKLYRLEVSQKNILLRNRAKTNSFTKGYLNLKFEIKLAYVVFFILNALLAFVILLEIVSFLKGQKDALPIEYSINVHKGINSLIFSIVSAIGIILYFFRNTLNFYSKNKYLKQLAIIWIILNVIIVLLTSYRNYIYVDEMGLTMKRIGVFIYLLLTIIGLYITLLKIVYKKSIFYMARVGCWSFFIVFILYQPFHWSRIITSYNLQHGHTDYNQLISLSQNKDLLLPLLPADTSSSIIDYEINENVISSFTKQLSIIDFEAMNTNSFISWNLFKSSYCTKIGQLKHHFKTLTLQQVPTNKSTRLFTYTQILKLKDCKYPNLDFLEYFPNLKSLIIENCTFDDYSYLEKTKLIEIKHDMSFGDRTPHLSDNHDKERFICHIPTLKKVYTNSLWLQAHLKIGIQSIPYTEKKPELPQPYNHRNKVQRL